MGKLRTPEDEIKLVIKDCQEKFDDFKMNLESTCHNLIIESIRDAESKIFRAVGVEVYAAVLVLTKNQKVADQLFNLFYNNWHDGLGYGVNDDGSFDPIYSKEKCVKDWQDCEEEG